ncbi:MAG: hypothetical protein ACI9Y1_003580 [Lentisphaeria bacterium]|jgi:hypothetical protein
MPTKYSYKCNVFFWERVNRRRVNLDRRCREHWTVT